MEMVTEYDDNYLSPEERKRIASEKKAIATRLRLRSKRKKKKKHK